MGVSLRLSKSHLDPHQPSSSITGTPNSASKSSAKSKMYASNSSRPHQAARKRSPTVTCLSLPLIVLGCSLATCQLQPLATQPHLQTPNSNNNNKQLLSNLFINQLLLPNAINRTAALAVLARQYQQQQNRLEPTSPRPAPPITAVAPPASSSPAPAANLQVQPTTRSSNSSLAAVRLKWRHMEQSIGGSIDSIASQLREVFNELGSLESQVSSERLSTGCRLSLTEFLDALDTQQLWASQMLDASARLPSGLLQGTLTELGSFDQCLAISHQLSRGPSSGAIDRHVSGQYCSVLVKPHLTPRPRLHTVCQRLPALSAAVASNQTSWRLLSQNSHQFYYVGLRLGLCAPSKCSRADLQLLLTNHLAKYELLAQVKSCQVSSQVEGVHEKLDSVQRAILSGLAALLVLTAVGTSLDYLSERRSNRDLKRQAAVHESTAPSHDPAKRIWHEYQVYQSSESSCAQPSDSDCVLSIGTQLNSLVAKRAAKQTTAFDANEHFKELWMRHQAAYRSQPKLSHPQRRQPTSAYLVAFLGCFSIRRNLRSLGKHVGGSSGDATASDMGDIRVIHGIRTFTMVWIIFGHTIGLVSPEMMNNLFSLAHLSCSSRILQALLNATLAVSTFFMLSGLVTVTSFARKCKSAQPLIVSSKSCHLTGVAKQRQQQQQQQFAKNTKQQIDDDSTSIISSLSSSTSSNRCIGDVSLGKPARARQPPSDKAGTWWPADFQPLLWLAMRYLRLTPAYTATVGLAVLLPALGSGPFWPEAAGAMGVACRRNWWLNLLYLNNFVETDKLCLIHSWYLSNDCQFFCVAMVLLAVFYKSRRAALLLLVTLTVASSAATFAITVANEFPPTIVTTSPAVAERWLFIHALYYKPWPHLSSYLVGLCAGYLIVIRERLELSCGWRRFAWLLWALVGLSLLNSVYPWNMGLQVEPLISGLHSATFRTLWAVCSAWLVFALVLRPRNPLSRLLGWHGFQLSSRLTYCAYLVHPLLIYYHLGSLRERMDSSVYGQLHRFVATLGLSYLFALLLSLLVESPSIQLQRLLSAGRLPAPRAPQPQPQQPARRLKRPSTLQSSNSWSASSSFSEPSPQTSETAATPAQAPRRPQPAPTQEPAPSRCHAHPERPLPGQAADCCAPAGGSVADADFQNKLAQAIGRGFRLRSKLAGGDTLRPAGARRGSQIKRLPADVPVFARPDRDSPSATKGASVSDCLTRLGAAQAPLVPNKRASDLGTFKSQPPLLR